MPFLNSGIVQIINDFWESEIKEEREGRRRDKRGKRERERERDIVFAQWRI